MTDQIPMPKTVLRGHKAQVHAITFTQSNHRLVTGDADGYVVLWDLTIMRAKAVWRAHENAILGLRGWGEEKLITHGRDNKLIVWKISTEDEGQLSTVLPLEEVAQPRPQPWILHLLEVNTMNFCSFACLEGEEFLEGSHLGEGNKGEEEEQKEETPNTKLLIAVPNTLASEAIDLYALPSQQRISTIRPGQKNGMAMCLSLVRKQRNLILICAFENGYSSVHALQQDGQWVMTYRSQAHTQPVLSLDTHPDGESYFTSSADAIIAKHPIPTTRQETASLPADGSGRIVDLSEEAPEGGSGPSLLSTALRGSAEASGKPSTVVPVTRLKEWEHPIKRTNTKHSGQQSLRIRSDGKIFATAGWDKNIRVYSAITLKELAVLQWHKTGCYAVALSDVNASEALAGTDARVEREADSLGEAPEKSRQDLLQRSGSSLLRGGLSVRERRIREAKRTHWVVGGSKDGKVSVWDIY